MQATEQITRTVERMGPGRAVVASLLAHGVDTVFGLDGSHVIQVFDALADAPSIAPLTFKHENNAAIAAEVYGRLTGRPGVVLVTAGPGATNSLSGIGGAYAAGAPLVHISGGVPVGRAVRGVPRRRRARLHPARLRGRHQVVGARRGRQRDPGRAGQAFADRRQRAAGPTHVEIAESALNVERRSTVEQATLVAGPTSVYDGADGLPSLDDLVARIDGAARDRDRRRARARCGRRSARRSSGWPSGSGAPVAHTWDGHAAMPTVHPLSIGRLVGPGPQPPDGARARGRGRPGARDRRAARHRGWASGWLGGPAPVVLLDASDEPSPSTGPAIGSVGAAGGGRRRSWRSPAGRARPTRRRSTPARGPASFSSAASTSSWSATATRGPGTSARPIDALARRMTPDMFVVSDVSNVKLWTPLQVPVWGPESHFQCGIAGARWATHCRPCWRRRGCARTRRSSGCAATPRS